MDAAVHALPDLEGRLTVTEREDLSDRIQQLAVVVAGLAGEVKAMRESRKSDYDHLREGIDQANHRRRNTDTTLEKAIDLLYAYPKPDHIEALIDDVEQLQGWRQRIIGVGVGIGLASGVLGGGIGAAIVQAAGS